MSNTSSPSTTDDVVRPFPSLAALRTAHRQLLDRHRRSEKTPVMVDESNTTSVAPNERDATSDLLNDVERFIRRAQATGTLLDSDSERWASQSLLDYWINTLYRAGYEPADPTLAEFDPTQAPELDDSRRPYRGLDAFREEDREFFFGRERMIEELIGRLNDRRLLAVVGETGSGKSSLVLGGLLASLKAGALPGSRGWHYYQMVPGTNPLANLARITCPPEIDPLQWTTRHTADFQQPDYLVRLVSLLRRPVVLIVDQFEEVFTLCIDEQTRKAFLNNLLNLIQAPGARHTVILTMRSAYEDKVALMEEFYKLFLQARAPMAALTAGELRDAIEKPAEVVGLKFEDGIVDALIKDILGEPAALPLLQFTLLKLWQKRERSRVTRETYHLLGGGREALARSADDFYRGLLPRYQTTAKRILTRMVRLEGLEINSNRIQRQTLYQIGEAASQIDRVLDELIEERLVRLTTGDIRNDDQVEVAHVALVHNWPRLKDWLEEEGEVLRQRQRLTTAAEQWADSGNDSGELLSELRLNEALRFKGLSPLEVQFVEESGKALEKAREEKEAAARRELEQAHKLIEATRLRAEEQEKAAEERRRAEAQALTARHLRQLVVVITVLLFIAIAAAVFALVQQQRAQEAVQARDILEKTVEAALGTASAAQGNDATSAATREAAVNQARLALATSQAAQDTGALSLLMRNVAQTQVVDAQATAQIAVAGLNTAQVLAATAQADALVAQAMADDNAVQSQNARAAAQAAGVAQSAAETRAQNAQASAQTAQADVAISQMAQSTAKAEAIAAESKAQAAQSDAASSAATAQTAIAAQAAAETQAATANAAAQDEAARRIAAETTIAALQQTIQASQQSDPPTPVPSTP